MEHPHAWYDEQGNLHVIEQPGQPEEMIPAQQLDDTMLDTIYVIRLNSANLFWTDQEPAGWTDLPNATRYTKDDKLPNLSIGEKVTLAEAAANA